MEETQRICGNRNDLALMGTKEAALQGAEALVICTEWKNFRAPDFDFIKEKLNTNALFDGRNMFEPSRMVEKGFAYYCIGRGLSVVGY
jgi:UDPglucose 6-dehydrogenase